MDFKTYCCLVGGTVGENGLGEGFKILRRIQILIIPLERFEDRIKTKHNKRNLVFLSIFLT